MKQSICVNSLYRCNAGAAADVYRFVDDGCIKGEYDAQDKGLIEVTPEGDTTQTSKIICLAPLVLSLDESKCIDARLPVLCTTL